MSIKWLYIAILLILAGSFSSCSEKEKGEQIPFTLIAKGENLDVNAGISKQDVVIRSQEEWDGLITVMDNLFAETEIDFDRYIVIAIIDEVRGSGPWEFAITRITNYSDRTVVSIKVSVPNRIAYQKENQPYHVIKTQKLDNRIEFKYVK